MRQSFFEEAEIVIDALKDLPTDWEGKRTILELKEAKFNWRQMEWWSFYFEYLARKKLCGEFQIPGRKVGNTIFDFSGRFNWDLKAKAIKSDDHRCILNDKSAMNRSVREKGAHGLVVALCDVEYNDLNRTFQKWWDELKGKKTPYQEKKRAEGALSRYRKTHAVLREILFLRFFEGDLEELDEMRQGKNSNDMPRPTKYMLNLERANRFIFHRISL